MGSPHYKLLVTHCDHEPAGRLLTRAALFDRLSQQSRDREGAAGSWVAACSFLNCSGAMNRDRGRDGGVSATPPSEPGGRISRSRLSGQWFLSETNHKHMSRVPD